MANLCAVPVNLCVIFIIFVTISTALSFQDFYSYDSSLVDKSSSVTLNLLKDKHSIHKRDATQQQNSTETTDLKNDLQKHNLGVNGTGIRKNYTLTSTSTTTTLRPLLTIDSSNFPSTLPKINVDNATVARNNQSGTDNDDEISISKFSEIEKDLNKTLLQNNITITQTDNHQYYNSSFITNPEVGQKYWVELENKTDVIVNDILSQSHRRAATVKLSFDFPFYGHLIRNITIATGGFLYTGDFVHSWLAATQYVAPLMANFDLSLSNSSLIKYVDNGTAFTIQWEQVALRDKPDDGYFTFQATLHNTGDIIFVYKFVSKIIETIKEDHHPVKVGISDAYIFDRKIFFVRRKTIYEYHKVNFRQEDIKNWTVIYLKPLPTCPINKDCVSCLTKAPSFDCQWCPVTSRCSNGMDRNRQHWLTNGCDKRKISNESTCSIENNPPDLRYTHEIEDNSMHDTSQASHDGSGLRPRASESMGASSIVTLLFIFALIAGIGIWVLYAFKNPFTYSGQILIKYRPSHWRWRRGEARYTAATIHM